MKIQFHKIMLLLQCGILSFLSACAGILILKNLWFCFIFVLSLIILQFFYITKQYSKTTETIKRLIEAIRFSDFALSFRGNDGKRIDPELTEAMEKALTRFKEKIYTLEEQHIYYNTLLSTIDSGILVLNRNGEIEWYNKTALKEFGLKVLHRVNELQSVHPSLPEILMRLVPGEIQVLRLERAGRIREIALNLVLFRIQGKELLLISLKNIHSVLENNEIEAWQKLIRVLTHEIMNSLAPIISLSETLTERVAGQNSDQGSPVILQALQAIHRRSKGLLEFVQNYRRLTRIPAPELSTIQITDLFSGLRKLLAGSNSQYVFHCPDSKLQILADRNQIEQVLINLIRNAEEACSETSEPEIKITAQGSINSGQVAIAVSDNGPGIIPEALDKIFVPFFTTKPGGSGIGLSLCKQIMTLHHGNITVKSEPGYGSTFTLLFFHN